MNRAGVYILGLVGVIAAASLARRLTTYAIAERSMEPGLGEGDWVLAIRRPRTPSCGSVVFFEHPHRPGFDLVKRVVAGPGDLRPDGAGRLGEHELWVLGDNPTAGSIDSRQLGPISSDRVDARALLRYRPLPPSWIARR